MTLHSQAPAYVEPFVIKPLKSPHQWLTAIAPCAVNSTVLLSLPFVKLKKKTFNG
jgi:hypothetical protein